MTIKSKVKIFPSLWAILETELSKLETLYKGFTTDMIAGLEKDSKLAFDGLEDDKPRLSPDVSIVNNVGILRIEGVITQKEDFFTFFFGGATLDTLAEDFKSLVENDDIDTIVLNIDSPGGTVSGVQEFANMIFDARERKRIITISSSIMASAAMWIGAAADVVLISGGTVVTGSIGVLTTHVDVSQLEADLGIKTTEITAGREKRIASTFAPLSDVGRSTLQGQVDKIMEVFVGDIAKFRGVSEQEVRSNMADGKTFIGDNAVKAGLVDDIKTFDLLIETINDGGFDMSLFSKKEANIGNLKADHEGLYNEAVAVGVESTRNLHEADVAKAKTDGETAGTALGANAERARIQGINDCTIIGQEALAKTLVDDGKTTPGEAAIQMINANKKANGDGLKKIADTSAKPVEDETEETVLDKTEMTAKQKWDGDPKLAKEFDSFEAFEAVEKNADNYRVLSK
jgi:signal peptide peptidase SppA